MTYKILKATSQELKTLDQAITDFNIQVSPELPRAEIHRLDFSVKSENGELLGGIQAYWVNWGILHMLNSFTYSKPTAIKELPLLC